jgi:cell division protein ZapE
MMDLFFNALPFADKRRQHFHRFMAGVHERLKKHRDVENPLELVAAEIAAETRVICFDEFVVTDIADAMLLGGLFAGLFARGVTLAATSNIVPDQLYSGGLQRQRFLPTIKLLKEHTDVVHVDGRVDYRLRALERADVYQTPLGATAERRLTEFFESIAPDEGDHGGAIELFGRRIDYKRAADGVIWFDFAQICDGPRSQNDYIEISRLYQTVLVSNVPRFDAKLENQARRFIALVDEFYDRRVKLIVSAAAPATEIYGGERLKHDFQRTQSRLQEMQSHDYLAEAHRP